MSRIHEGQGSLFGVPLAAPGEQARPAKPQRRRNRAPLRNCRACGGRFASWDAARYCTRAACIKLRDSGLSPEQLDPCRVTSGYDPATSEIPF